MSWLGLANSNFRDKSVQQMQNCNVRSSPSHLHKVSFSWGHSESPAARAIHFSSTVWSAGGALFQRLASRRRSCSHVLVSRCGIFHMVPLERMDRMTSLLRKVSTFESVNIRGDAQSHAHPSPSARAVTCARRRVKGEPCQSRLMHCEEKVAVAQPDAA